MRIAGFISDQLTENPVKVNYTWYDKSSGIVQWNFENMGSTTRSFILLRGSLKIIWPVTYTREDHHSGLYPPLHDD